MSDQLQHIRQIIEQSDGYLSFEMMERYIAGTLSYHEQHLVEKELLANPFLADAMKGLKASRSNIARSGVEDVNALIDEMAAKEKVVKKIPYVKITGIAAAALVLIVGSVALLNTTGETQSESLAQTEATTEKAPKTSKEKTTTHEWKSEAPTGLGETAAEEVAEVAIEEVDEIVVVEEEEEPALPQEDSEIVVEESINGFTMAQDSIDIDMNVTTSMNSTKDTGISEVKKSEEQVDVVSSEQRSMDVVVRTEAEIANEMMAYNRLPALSLSTKKSKSPDYGKESYNEKHMDKKEKTRAGTSANFYDEAVTAYNNGIYKEAASKFDMVLSADPSNAQAQLYGGVAHLKNGNTNRAEDLLKGASKTRAYEEHATWYLAATYLKEGKKRKAANSLKELKQSATYGTKAKSILDEL